MKKTSAKFAKLECLVRERLACAPACHDADHTFRVLHNARLIAEQEPGAKLAVVECAALLHDIARSIEMENRGKDCHARIGAEMSPVMLRECGYIEDGFITHVAACVRTHRFRGSDSPESVEAEIIYDADKLDSLGAIGIGRAFHFAGGIGARVHNRKEEALAGESYGREDSAYREYLVKLCKVQDRLLTETGRRLAVERCELMHRFFNRLNLEVFGSNGTCD